MLALLVPAVVTAAVAGPSFLAVSRISARRSFAPLVRGSLERTCVLAAAGVAAISIFAQIMFLALRLANTLLRQQPTARVTMRRCKLLTARPV